ncbi:hypothetical protein ACIBEJ_05550 [Nonomuraea sp. NPDC050790]|uniref:hypothetical protein n=1 Tax=Nonomuraea sp. NPDC050790 TaxID=3364371 RepID=UPI003790FD2F
MDVAVVAGEVMPYVSAAVGAYGAAVLAKTQEAAAQSTVGLGTRILQRVFGRSETPGAAPGDGTGDGTPDDGTPGAGTGAGSDAGTDAGRRAGVAAIEELAAHPGDADYVAALRLAIRRVLEAEPELAREIRAMVGAPGSVTASGERSVAIGGSNAGLVVTGDDVKVEYPR